MGSICPTVLAGTIDDYREQMETAAAFADRIQIDLGDGDFTTKSVGVVDAWWPHTVQADIHLMYREPFEAVKALVKKKPHMIILHAEANGVEDILTYIQEQQILAGVALLQTTNVAAVRSYIARADHVLIFSGSLGSFGGTADLSLLGKIPEIRAIKNDVEIGWDGGATIDNVRHLSEAGVDVINVGGAIQKAARPENAYRALWRQISD